MSWMLAITAGALFGVGLYLLLLRDAIKFVLGFSLILGATNLYLLGCGTFRGERAPYVSEAAAAVDPIPQALVLTAIVIGFAVLTLLASMVLLLAWRTGSLDLDRMDRLSR